MGRDKRKFSILGISLLSVFLLVGTFGIASPLSINEVFADPVSPVIIETPIQLNIEENTSLDFGIEVWDDSDFLTFNITSIPSVGNLTLRGSTTLLSAFDSFPAYTIQETNPGPKTFLLFFVYTPPLDYNSADNPLDDLRITYTVEDSDGLFASPSGLYTITIPPADDVEPLITSTAIFFEGFDNGLVDQFSPDIFSPSSGGPELNVVDLFDYRSVDSGLNSGTNYYLQSNTPGSLGLYTILDAELGYKWNADPPAVLKYMKDTTQITWQGKNLKAFDAYKFDW